MNYPLDRQRGGHHRRRPGAGDAVEHLCARRASGHADLFARAPALDAAEHPEPGDWLYFVTVDPQGTTLFTRDYQQHLANIELAKHNGVLDSAR